MRRTLCACALLLASCAQPDPRQYLDTQLEFLKAGVQLEAEEKEVRRVLWQRQLRVVARVQGPGYVAIGAATRDQRFSAIRLITARGVVIAEDATLEDLFEPASVALLEHFGGRLGEYVFVALARVPRGYDVGCIALHRILPDGRAVQAELDASAFGSRACISNLAPARMTHMRATVAWPSLHVLVTPQLDVELAFVEPPLGQQAPVVPVARVADRGEWLDAELTRLNTLRLARASFSERHAAGIARAAFARLTGHDTAAQLAAYRNAVAQVPPGSTEAELVAEASAHIERDWTDAPPEPDESSAESEPSEPADGAPDVNGETVIEPTAP